MRIRDALDAARAQIPSVDARLLLQHVTGLSHAGLISEAHSPLSEADQVAYEALVTRRAAGEPVAYLIGIREFYGSPFRVTPAVLIPRPETEHLVDAALPFVRAHPAARVLDLGTGSGVVAITLARLCPSAHVVAADFSAAALVVAAENAQRLHAPIECVLSHWFDAFSGQRFDVIVSNPPYIAAHDAHLDEGDLRFEPRQALTDNSQDGLASLRTLIAHAPEHLNAGGALWVEHGFDQADAARQLLHAAGFRDVTSHRDFAGIERISGGHF